MGTKQTVQIAAYRKYVNLKYFENMAKYIVNHSRWPNQ